MRNLISQTVFVLSATIFCRFCPPRIPNFVPLRIFQRNVVFCKFCPPRISANVALTAPHLSTQRGIESRLGT